MTICEILKQAKAIAVIGISDKPYRDSGMIALFLKEKGYQVSGVHPQLKEVSGIPVFQDVSDVPGDIDIIDIFLSGDKIAPLIPGILSKKPKCIWLQLGVHNTELEERAREEGIVVVTGQCIAVEYRNCV